MPPARARVIDSESLGRPARAARAPGPAGMKVAHLQVVRAARALSQTAAAAMAGNLNVTLSRRVEE